MSLTVTTTGSFPHAYPQAEKSIRLAVKEQIAAGIDLLVDGQVRADIVGIFANSIGLVGDGMPYVVRGKVGNPKKPTSIRDLRTAAKSAKGKPIKAHITGPTVMAENCVIAADAPELYRDEAGFKQLTLDIAQALAEEARFIAAESKELNIPYLQIDEPSFVFGVDLETARQALQIITDAWKQAGGGAIILHVCGDYGYIFKELLNMPVDILNIEIEHFQEISAADIEALKESGKKLAFGVIAVNTESIPSPERVAREVIYAGDRCGMELVWGITPVCGMRLSSQQMPVKRMKVLKGAKDILAGGRKSVREAA
jgi:5-methyltetrahydropteroyltriglutamate--homocysteine methyltransferase